MTRHARNATASAVYTYHEKRKDAGHSGYGQKRMRLAKDSVKDFDCCCLTLQPCLDPVVTPDGYLFDKAAILEYILKKKQDYKRHLKAWEKDQERLKHKSEEDANAREKKREEMFLKREDGVASGRSSGSGSGNSSSISNMINGRDKELPSYWIPGLTPASEQTAVPKPSSTVICPMSGKPLKAKELITVKFTPVPPEGSDAKKGIVARERRWMCAVTRDVLNNASPNVVLKPTGDVVTMDCVEKLIKKDMLHPITGETLKDSDIIPLKMGGTGFASVNENLEAKQNRPALQV